MNSTNCNYELLQLIEKCLKCKTIQFVMQQNNREILTLNTHNNCNFVKQIVSMALKFETSTCFDLTKIISQNVVTGQN